jgi:hypothetical protein
MILRHGAGWRDTRGPGSMEIVTEGTPIAPLDIHEDAFPAGPGALVLSFRRQDARTELAARATAVRALEKRRSRGYCQKVFVMRPGFIRQENALETASETGRAWRCFRMANGGENAPQRDNEIMNGRAQ